MGSHTTKPMVKLAGIAGRRGWIGTALALIVLAALSVATLATAQETKPSGPLKGQWSLEVETPGGRMPMSIAFRGSDQGGVLVTPGGMVEVEYRQAGSAFSVSAELPGAASPTGSGQSLLLRGTQTSATTATGTVMLIGDGPGGTGGLPYEVTSGTFSAAKQ